MHRVKCWWKDSKTLAVFPLLSLVSDPVIFKHNSRSQMYDIGKEWMDSGLNNINRLLSTRAVSATKYVQLERMEAAHAFIWVPLDLLCLCLYNEMGIGSDCGVRLVFKPTLKADLPVLEKFQIYCPVKSSAFVLHSQTFFPSPWVFGLSWW